MANAAESGVPRTWRTTQVYAMACICLVIGLALGYLFRGSASRSVPTLRATQTTAPAGTPADAHPQMPSLEDMKRMADKKAEPLLAKLKSDPNNSDLLNQIGTLYKATHQFKEAAGYFKKAIDADPKNVAARTDLASCLFYEGNADGAINQLQQSLRYDPKDVRESLRSFDRFPDRRGSKIPSSPAVSPADREHETALPRARGIAVARYYAQWVQDPRRNRRSRSQSRAGGENSESETGVWKNPCAPAAPRSPDQRRDEQAGPAAWMAGCGRAAPKG